MKTRRLPSERIYIVSYAYEVSYYRDFAVSASSQGQALHKAKEALRAGRFDDLIGVPNETIENPRVFLLGPAKDSADSFERL